MRRINIKDVVFAANMLWFLIAAPFKLTFQLSRLIGRSIGAWILITNDSFPCTGCGEKISLLGRWECGWCGYVFDGFFFARCVLCGAVPPYIKCQNCGISVKNPTIFP
jgi:hypothetical protein